MKIDANPFAAGDALLSPLIADALPSLIFVAAPGGATLFVNRYYREYTGRSGDSLLGGGWHDIIHPDDFGIAAARFGAADEAPFARELRLRDADGRYRWFLIRLAPLRDSSGAVVQYLGNGTEVDDLRCTQDALAAAVAAKDTLLHEVSHRVKNSLQLVTALLSLQAAQTPDPGARRGIVEARNRIGVVAGVHQRLYWQNDDDCIDLASYARTLAEEALAGPDCPPGLRLEFVAPEPVQVPVARAVPLALIVSELINNICIHAFPDRPAGIMHVEVKRGDGLTIEVCDDGVGLPPGFEPRASKGLGMRIATALARQAKAELKLMPVEHGAGFIVQTAL